MAAALTAGDPRRDLIREATADDIPEIIRMVRELARFERLEQAMVATEADLLRDGFGAAPYFRCRLAELEEGAVGFSLWHHTYSTFQGRPGIHLEDLFVRETARRRGIGTALLADLAREARRLGCNRIDLAVLDWNPARRFYEALGFRERGDWIAARLDGPALERLAGGARRQR